MKIKRSLAAGIELHPPFLSNFRLFKYKYIFHRLTLVFTFLYLHLFSFSQDSSHLRIALLTCTPGEDLYTTFGHTAIRVTDSSSLTDYVFNYGTFSFKDPGFYIKFIRGKLSYYLSVEKFEDFKEEYQEDNRGITEQVLSMTGPEKIALMEALRENAREQNKYYKYDFFLDNCTTRARDILLKFKKEPAGFKAVMPERTRFRQAIHLYLDKNKKYWSKLGIDILLGVPTDAAMTTGQSQFLPDNLMKSLDTGNENRGWVLSTTNLFPISQDDDKGFVLTPSLLFSVLLATIVLLSFSNNTGVKNFLLGFDGIFFFFTGVLGILLIFMWIATDHSMTKGNYNLLWAWPVNAVIAFYINNKQRWVRRYCGISAVALTLVLAGWFFLPQQMNNALIPLVLLLIFRSGVKYLGRPHQFL